MRQIPAAPDPYAFIQDVRGGAFVSAGTKRGVMFLTGTMRTSLLLELKWRLGFGVFALAAILSLLVSGAKAASGDPDATLGGTGDGSVPVRFYRLAIP